VVPSGQGPDQAIAETNVALSEDGYDLAMVGTLNELRFDLIPIDLRPLDPGRARLRVIHGSPDTGPLDPAFSGGDVLFPTVDYAGKTDYAELDAGTYDLEVRYAGTDTPVLQLPGTVLDAGTATDFVVVGEVADATLQGLLVTSSPGIYQPVGRPAQVRAGGCGAALDKKAGTPLNDVLAPHGDSFGQSQAATAESSFTTIAVSLDDLLAADHAVVVTRSPDEPEVIACGEIGGGLTDVGALVVGLREQNGSGFAGVAVLAANVTDPATTDVSLFLAAGLVVGAAPAIATPAAALIPT
jgi:hypothetical protein